MIILHSELVCVDVDNTLVAWEGTTYKPMKRNIEALINHARRGHSVIVWSAGGIAWTRRIIEELGLEKYVTVATTKPRWFLDDKPPTEWSETYWLSDGGEIYDREIKGTSRFGKESNIMGLNPYSFSYYVYPETSKQG